MNVTVEKFTPAERECITEIMERGRTPFDHPAYPEFKKKYKG